MKQASVYAPLATENQILLEDEIVDSKNNEGGDMSSSSYTFGDNQGIQ